MKFLLLEPEFSRFKDSHFISYTLSKQKFGRPGLYFFSVPFSHFLLFPLFPVK